MGVSGSVSSVNANQIYVVEQVRTFWNGQTVSGSLSVFLDRYFFGLILQLMLLQKADDKTLKITFANDGMECVADTDPSRFRWWLMTWNLKIMIIPMTKIQHWILWKRWPQTFVYFFLRSWPGEISKHKSTSKINNYSHVFEGDFEKINPRF